jgi:hypothetical protein
LWRLNSGRANSASKTRFILRRQERLTPHIAQFPRSPAPQIAHFRNDLEPLTDLLHKLSTFRQTVGDNLSIIGSSIFEAEQVSDAQRLTTGGIVRDDL